MNTRTGFAFSPNGRFAACLTSVGPGDWRVEHWPLDPPGPPRTLSTVRPTGVGGQALPLDDGRILLCEPARPGREEGTLSLVDPADEPAGLGSGRQPESTTEQPVDRTRARPARPAVRFGSPGLRVFGLPAPSPDPEETLGPPATGGDTPASMATGAIVSSTTAPNATTAATALAVAVETTVADGAPRSRIWLVTDVDDGLVVELVTELSGLVAGGVRLSAHRIGLTHATVDPIRGTSARVTGIQLDLTSGAVTPVCPAKPSIRVLLSTPTVWVVVDGPRAPGWCRPTLPRTHLQVEDLRWPLLPVDPTGGPPVALAAAGDRIAFRVATDGGATSRLEVYRVGRVHSSPVALPAGVLGRSATWRPDGLIVPFAPADRPTGLVRIDPDSTTRGTDESGRPGGAGDTAMVWLDRAGSTPPAAVPRLMRLPAPAVVHGDWRTADRVVIALHGGPDSSWQLRPDQLLSELAAAGTAVVAVNPRRGARSGDDSGPTGGFGRSGGVPTWGGSDLEDVLLVAESVRAARTDRAGRSGTADRLGLLGSSYGGWLGLLALGTAPELWDRAVLLAPFLSPARLFADAGPRVRGMLHRAGAAAVEAPDALRIARDIQATLLVIVGSRDRVVPLKHARDLVTHVGAGARYLELPDAGHDLVSGPGADRVIRAAVGLLGNASPTREGSDAPRAAAVV